MADGARPTDKTEFDTFSRDYDEELQKGLSLTGEDKTYFAKGRMLWVKKRLSELGITPEKALDFGCGTGGSLRYFFDILGTTSLIGTDPSTDSLDVAAREHTDLGGSLTITTPGDARISGQVDFAFCNGVFHHIPVAERSEAVSFVYESLRPGGVFAFWENNAWNPATRFIMSRVPFDRDAVLLFPHGAKKLLRDCGFGVLHTDYLFIFPSRLATFRRLEPNLCKLPFGGQYMVLCQK